MNGSRLTKILLAVAIILTACVGGTFAYYYFSMHGIEKTEPSASASAVPTASSTPTTAPTPTAAATASPTPTATAAPTPTPTAVPTVLPVLSLSVSSTGVSSINGADCQVTVSADSDAVISVSSSSGIKTWYQTGYLFIYPAQSGTVTVTASKSGYQSSSVTIAVTYTVQTAVPTSTPISTGSWSGTLAETDADLLQPNVTREEDLTFWFRGCMSDCKDLFFDQASAYGVDPFLAIAIADHETGYGGSDACNTSNNFGGLMDSNGIRYYESKEEGIKALMYLLQVYKAKGRDTVESIGEYYCGGSSEWINRVTTIYNSFHQ